MAALASMGALLAGCGSFNVAPALGDAGNDAGADGTVDALPPADAASVDGALDVVGACSPTTCPGGCCDALGRCQVGTDHLVCGNAGQACDDCASVDLPCIPASDGDGGGACQTLKVVTCTSSTCAGCCEGNACRVDAGFVACGSGGNACVACPLGQACVNGACAPSATCGPATCAGCCDGATCVAGQSTAACGTGGAACAPCTASCFPTGPFAGGVCGKTIGCGPVNCGGGCCDPYYVCHPGTDTLACGGNGFHCGVCTAGGTCAGNQCSAGSCGPLSCDGCCDDFGVCQDGSIDATACGRQGARCLACPTGGTCNAGACSP